MVSQRGSCSSPSDGVAISAVIPYLHVADVDRSVQFYGLLGLKCDGTFRDQTNRSCWACVGQGHAQLMLALASEPVVASQQAMLVYMHANDVKALRHHLLACGVQDGSGAGHLWGKATPRGMVSTVTFPDHMERGELRAQDPDGYVVLIGQTR